MSVVTDVRSFPADCLPVSGRGFIPNAPIREVVLRAIRQHTIEGVTELASLIGCEEASLRRSLGLKADGGHCFQSRMSVDRALLVLDVLGVFPVEVGL